MVIVTGIVIVLVSLLGLSAVAILAQRAKLAAMKVQHWDQEREIQRWRADAEAANRAFHQAWGRFVEIAEKPPLVIQPPDVAAIVHELGESIGTAIYGRQMEIREDLQKQLTATAMHPNAEDDQQWFPDVEFDPQMGPLPQRGGWINGPSNQNVTPVEGQTPSHAVTSDGRVVRLDGQSVFQSGVGAPTPEGGVER